MTDARRFETVACLGSSTTASRGTYKWIDELEKRPQNRRFRFVNLGVGGDLSFNTVAHLDRVIALRPERAIVLIGTNDILATVFPSYRRFARAVKGLSHEPSPAAFKGNLTIIVRRLQREADVPVGLSSLAPLGEEPHSSHPVQAWLNELIATYNDVIRCVASIESADYIPFHEAYQEQLAGTPTKPFTHFSFWSFYRDYLFREMILRQSFDEISHSTGWEFHIDGIHLHTKGGRHLPPLSLS